MMKSHTTNQERESASRAAATRQRNTGPDADGVSVEGHALQQKRQALIDASPYISAQRKRIGSLSPPAQKTAPEEGLDILISVI